MSVRTFKLSNPGKMRFAGLMLLVSLSLNSSVFAQKYSYWGVKGSYITSSYEGNTYNGYSAGIIADWLIGGDLYSLFGEINYTNHIKEVSPIGSQLKVIDMAVTIKAELFSNAFYIQSGFRPQLVMANPTYNKKIMCSALLGIGKEIYIGELQPFFISLYYDFGLTTFSNSRLNYISINFGKRFSLTGK